jgi:hypothetical protein
MSALSFEHEALRYALDGDSVQNLLREEVPRWRIDPATAVEVVRRLALQGDLSLYETRQEDGQDVAVEPALLSNAYLDSRPYTFTLKKDRTISRLNEIASRLRLQPQLTDVGDC